MHDHKKEQGAQDAAAQPDNPARRRIFQAAAAAGLGSALPAVAQAAPARAAAPAVKGSLDAKLKAQVKNVVVNLNPQPFDWYGRWPDAPKS